MNVAWDRVTGAEQYLVQSLQGIANGVEKWSTGSTMNGTSSSLGINGFDEGSTQTFRIRSLTAVSGPSRDESRVTFTMLVNRAPVGTAATVSTPEDSAKIVTLAATDADKDAVSFALGTAPKNGTATLSGTTVTYTPNANFVGRDTFTFTASDGKLTSTPATVAVDVTPVNDAPTAQPGRLMVEQGGSLAVTLVGVDIDGDVLTYVVTLAPGHGTVQIAGNRATYTAAAGYTGSDLFRFAASDGKVQSPATDVTVEVMPKSSTPVPVPTLPPAPLKPAPQVVAVGSGADGAVAVLDGQRNRIDRNPFRGRRPGSKRGRDRRRSAGPRGRPRPRRGVHGGRARRRHRRRGGPLRRL